MSEKIEARKNLQRELDPMALIDKDEELPEALEERPGPLRNRLAQKAG